MILYCIIASVMCDLLISRISLSPSRVPMCILFVSLVVAGYAPFTPPGVPEVARRSPAPRASVQKVALDEIRSLPMEPTAELGPLETAFVVCAGLKYNNWPRVDAGVERLFHHLSPMGRVAIAPTPPKSGLQGGVTLEYFLEEAGSAALGALMFCSRFEFTGDLTISPGSQARGRIATQMVTVHNAPEDAALIALVSLPREDLEAILAAVRTGEKPALPDVTAGAPKASRFLFKLEEERRPPNQGCWILQEMFPMAKTRLQELNEGGEEFEQKEYIS